MLKYIKIIPRFIIEVFKVIYAIPVDLFIGVNNRFISAYRINKDWEIRHNKKRTRESYEHWEKGYDFYFEVRRGLRNYLKLQKDMKVPFFGIVEQNLSECYILLSKDSGLKSFEALDKKWEQIESSVIDCYLRSEKDNYQKLLIKKINIHKDIKKDLEDLDVIFSDKLRLTQKGEFLSEKLWEKDIRHLKINCDQLLKLYSESYISDNYHDITCQHNDKCRHGNTCNNSICYFDKICDCIESDDEDIYIKTINGKNIYHLSIAETNVIGEYKINYMIKYEPLSSDFFHEDCMGVIKHRKEKFADNWSVDFRNEGEFYSPPFNESLKVDSLSRRLSGVSFNKNFFNYMMKHDEYFKNLVTSCVSLGFLKKNEINNSPKEFDKMVGVVEKIAKNNQESAEAASFFVDGVRDLIKENNGNISVEELEGIYDLTKMNCEDVNIYDMKFEKEVQDWLIFIRFLEKKGVKSMEGTIR